MNKNFQNMFRNENRQKITVAEAPHWAALVLSQMESDFKTRLIGGERGIRTLDKVAPVLPFQGSDLNRSSSSPRNLYY